MFRTYLADIEIKLKFFTPLGCDLMNFLPSILLFSQRSCKNLKALR